MIYIFTALYCEAHPFIEYYGLKKVTESVRFQQFYSESAGIRLTVCGVGEIAAAAAVSSICTRHSPTSSDFLLNTGVCAAKEGTEGIYLIHKLTEQATGRTFYPDILYRHGFMEAWTVTCMMPYSSRTAKSPQEESVRKRFYDTGIDLDSNVLYDMEAAAVYQAGAYFFGPHQMLFLKIVSDHGDVCAVSKEQVKQLSDRYKDHIFEFLEFLCSAAKAEENRTGRKAREECRQREFTVLYEKLCADLHCSKTMADSLKQHLNYAFLSGANYETAVLKMYACGMLPCKDKREGKQCFEELKRRLF